MVSILLGLKINIASSTTEANAKTASESDILIQFYQGYKWAFDELYRRYYSICFQFAYDIIKDPEEAKDIILETFLKIWINKIVLENIKHFKTFLFVFIRNKIITRNQKIFTEEKYKTIWLKPIPVTEIFDDPNKQYNIEEMKFKIMEVIDKLDSENERNVVNLTLQNKTNEEIAEMLKMSEEMISKTKRHAIQHLKKLLLNNLI